MILPILKKEVEETCNLLQRIGHSDKAILVNDLYQRWIEAENQIINEIKTNQEANDGM